MGTERRSTTTCASVPHIARDHLGDGVLFETRHEGRHYTWRLIHSGEGNVAAFFDALEVAVGECAQMEMLRTVDTTTSARGSDGTPSGLPPAQEGALQAAVSLLFLSAGAYLSFRDKRGPLHPPVLRPG